MSLAAKAISPETVKRFTLPTHPAKDELQRKIEELEKAVRSLSKKVEQIDGIRRNISHLNGYMITSSRVYGGKAKHSKIEQIESIIRFVCKAHKVDMERVCEYQVKDPNVREARKIAMWVAYQFRPYVIRDIARAFCRKDHGTVWHAIRSLDEKQVARAQKLLDDYRRTHHAEAEIATGSNGASTQVDGRMAEADEQALP